MLIEAFRADKVVLPGGTYTASMSEKDYLKYIYGADNLTAGKINVRTQATVKSMTPEELKHAQMKYAYYSTNGYAQGGVVDYTGIAMVHGTKQKSETVFNANDSAKLYEMVHNTPNLMADMLNQAKTIAGRTGSVAPSVSIGAISVYANNPQEFTKGLDKQLDRYFKTKLTQSYTQ